MSDGCDISPMEVDRQAWVDLLAVNAALREHYNNCPLTKGHHKVEDLYKDDADKEPEVKALRNERSAAAEGPPARSR